MRWHTGLTNSETKASLVTHFIYPLHERGITVPFKDPQKRKEYQRKYHSRWYQSNGERRRKQVNARRRRTREWIHDLKSEGECVECGLSGSIAPWALDYHHLDGTVKDASVSYLVGNGYGRKRIEKEIEKCELICSNCHRTRHYQEYKAGQAIGAEQGEFALRERTKRKSHARRQRKRKQAKREEE